MLPESLLSPLACACRCCLSWPPRRATIRLPADAEAATKTADAKNSKKQAGQRIISLVLLQNAPRKLSHGEIAHAVEEGAGVKIPTDDVITREGYHFVSIRDEKYTVNDVAEAYFAEADELAAELDAPDLVAAIKACTAWVSVDWSGSNDEADLRDVYQPIATTIAHLSNATPWPFTVRTWMPLPCGRPRRERSWRAAIDWRYLALPPLPRQTPLSKEGRKSHR